MTARNVSICNADLVTAGTATPTRTGSTDVWRVVAGSSAAILVGTAILGVITLTGAGDHLPLRARLDNVVGGGLLVLLVAIPACVFGFWPLDAATLRLPRLARAGVFAAVGAVAGAAAGLGLAALRGTPLEGAIVGAGIGLVSGLAGFAGATWGARSRGVAVGLAAVTVV